MKFGVVVFPGSNCDADCYHAIQDGLGEEAAYIWHKESRVQGFDALILPGGFSYGDYLRCGAIARFSPIMPAVIDFARQGGPVIGICNGFQILLEAGMLPGAMLRNRSLKFICRNTELKVRSTDTPFTGSFARDEIIRMPIAHGEGNYYCDPETLKQLQEEDRIIFTYCDRGGEETPAANPNGSLLNIAGICSQGRNVLGMMPHPERHADRLLGGQDGLRLFVSMLDWLKEAK